MKPYKEEIKTAILYATGFSLYGKDDFYDNTNVNFEHTQIEMIKAVDKGDYEIISDDDPLSAHVLGCKVYF